MDTSLGKYLKDDGYICIFKYSGGREISRYEIDNNCLRLEN